MGDTTAQNFTVKEDFTFVMKSHFPKQVWKQKTRMKNKSTMVRHSHCKHVVQGVVMFLAPHLVRAVSAGNDENT